LKTVQRTSLAVIVIVIAALAASLGCTETAATPDGAAGQPDSGPHGQDGAIQSDTAPLSPDAAAPTVEGAPSKASLGTYVILTNLPPSDAYYQAVTVLQGHRKATVVTFKDGDYPGILTRLKQLKPEFVAIVAKPITIDVNFGYRILELATKLDDDPFVDFAHGFITGKDAQAAVDFVKGIIKAEQQVQAFPKTIVGFGPSTIDAIYPNTFSWASGFSSQTIYHKEADKFPGPQLKTLEGNGLMRFWGHGMPERIVKSLTAKQVQSIDVSPAVIFGGACYTGVVARSFDPTLGQSIVKSRIIPPQDSFCLSLISSGTTGFFGALDPDHGITSVQEFEHLMTTARPLGAVARHNYDTIVMANLPKPLGFPTFTEGQPRPKETTFETMLNGAAARVLFGDPAFRPLLKPCYQGPYEIKTIPGPDSIFLEVQVKEKKIYGSFVDIFRFGLGGGQYMNDKLYFTLPVDGPISKVSVVKATCQGAALEHDFLSHAVELWGGARTLHVHLDFPYDKLKLGCKVELTVKAAP
jgi:hypothetical protein